MSEASDTRNARLRGAAFLLAWIVLIVVVAFAARDTQTLIEDQNAVLANQDSVLANQDAILAEEKELIQTSLASVCGSWRGTFLFLAAWSQSNDAGLTKKQSTELRKVFEAEYEKWCGPLRLEQP